jgi:hypothetical protein
MKRRLQMRGTIHQHGDARAAVRRVHHERDPGDGRAAEGLTKEAHRQAPVGAANGRRERRRRTEVRVDLPQAREKRIAPGSRRPNRRFDDATAARRIDDAETGGRGARRKRVGRAREREERRRDQRDGERNVTNHAVIVAHATRPR